MSSISIPLMILLTLAGIALTGCHRSGSAPVSAQAAPPPSVVVSRVLVRTIPIYGEFVGQTAAKDTVNIQARVGGFLEKFLFTEGFPVRKGEVLFQIEQAAYQAELNSAMAKLAQDQASLLKAQKDVARLQPLVQEQAAPQQDLDSSIAAQAQYQAAIKGDLANIDTAKLNLSYTTVRSPIDGIIGRVQVTAGNLVGQGETTQLATISSYNPIYVNFTVPEASYVEYRRRNPGPMRPRRISIELILADNKPFPHRGFINFVDRTVDVTTGTLALRGEVPNPDAVLRPGQFVRVRMVLETRPNALLVPKEAVTETLSTRAVLVVGEDNKAALKTITTDGEYEQFYIVHSGLSGGERVIVAGLMKVRPGMTVAPQLRASSPASAGE